MKKKQNSDTQIIVPASIVKGRYGNEDSLGSTFKGMTKNNVQIADVYMLSVQKSIEKELRKSEIYQVAIKKIEPLVEKYELDRYKNREEQRKNQKIIASLLSQEVKKEVVKQLQGKTNISIPFNEFVEKLNISSLRRKGTETLRLSALYEIMSEARSNAVLKCREDVWREDEQGKLIKEINYSVYNLVPSFTIVVQGHEEEGETFDTFKELVSSRKHNKEQYIKEVRFSLNVDAMAVLAFPRIEDGYSITDRKHRIGFSQYAFQLDWLVRSIFKVQHMQSINYYTLKDIYSILGVNNPRYADFKRRVLMPAIEEINNAGAINVEVLEHKTGRKVSAISFSIKRNFGGVRGSDGVMVNFSLEYFIAVQQFYKERYIGEKLWESDVTFEEYFATVSNFKSNFYVNRNKKMSPEDTDLTLEEWKDLYEKETLSWNNLCTLYQENYKRFKKRGYVLSDKKLGILDRLGNYIRPIGIDGTGALLLPSEQLDYLTQALKGEAL